MFQKGNTLGKGRARGSKNKATTEVRQSFQTLVEGSLQQLEDDLRQLEPKDRLRIIIDLSKFFLPVLKSVDVQNDTNNENILIEKLLEISDADFEKIYKNE